MRRKKECKDKEKEQEREQERERESEKEQELVPEIVLRQGFVSSRNLEASGENESESRPVPKFRDFGISGENEPFDRVRRAHSESSATGLHL